MLEKKKCLVLLAFHREILRGTETHMQEQVWKLYRKFATEKISLWQTAKEPHSSSHAQDLTVVEQEVMFLVDDHYWICLPPYNHHTISLQIQNPTLQTASVSRLG